MPILKQASAAVLAASALAAAHAQQPPAADLKAAVPAATSGTTERQATPRLPASGRNAFSNTAMPIDIKGEGLSLPTGVAPSEELPKPPAPGETAPTPTAK